MVRRVVKKQKKGEGLSFTQRVPEYNVLKQKLLNGEIDQLTQPGTIHSSDEAFSKYDLASFRSGFYRLKGKLGLNNRVSGMFSVW